MTLLDIAQAARGKLRDGYSAPQAGGAAMVADMAYGTATADSSGGFVTIVMDNMPAGAVQADYEFTVACDAPITNGDRVALVTINGTEKAISMGTLSEQVADVVNYFWADNAGVHVSTEEGDPDGAQNIVLNSSGLTIREGSDVSASFSASEVSLGDNCTLANIDGAQGTVQLSLMDLAYMKMKRGMRYDKTTGTTALYPILALGATDGYVDIERLNVDTLTASNLFVDANLMVWEEIYYNDSYAPVTFTLSEDVGQYAFIDIMFTDGTRRYIQRAPVDQGLTANTVTTSITRTVSNSSGMYISSVTVSINGTAASWTNGGQSYITANGASYSANTNDLHIIAVYGIKTTATTVSANGVSF